MPRDCRAPVWSGCRFFTMAREAATRKIPPPSWGKHRSKAMGRRRFPDRCVRAGGRKAEPGCWTLWAGQATGAVELRIRPVAGGAEIEAGEVDTRIKIPVLIDHLDARNQQIGAGLGVDTAQHQGGGV